MKEIIHSDCRQSMYLRLSITEVCSFHCQYCQPNGIMEKVAKTKYLTPQEIQKLIQSLADLGVTRVRLTGGEPLIRPEVLEIIERIRSVSGIREISLTTNGMRLQRFAADLKRAGLDRINVHLDSLNNDRFSKLTKNGSLKSVLDGIDAATKVGLTPVKVNTVLMKGINDDELVDFCNYAGESGVTVRFIELMNTGPSQEFVRKHFLSAKEAKRYLGKQFDMVPRFDEQGGAPAQEFLIPDLKDTTIGFIASETEPFCSQCNRLRVTAGGRILGCLYEPNGVQLMPLLRNKQSDLTEFNNLLREVVSKKKSFHPEFGQTGKRHFSMAIVGG